MPSSRRKRGMIVGRAPRAAALLATLLATLLAACSNPPASPADAVGATACTVEGRPTPSEAAQALALRQRMESSPLYRVAAAEGLATCKVRHQADGTLLIEYRFRRGGTITVTRDERIEYLEQDARFTLPTGEAPETILAGAERAAFGANGCGIDWREPEVRPAEGNAAATETIFRGEVCNCQARIRRDAAGHVVGMLFRSAC